MHIPPRTPLVADAAAALSIAYMMEKHWPHGPVCPLPLDQFPEALVPHYRWSIGAVVEQGAPPTFGQYLSCSPAQRCPGCTTGCGTETLATDVHRHTGKDVILMVMGSNRSDPQWLRAEIMIAGAPRLSGVSIPFMDNEGSMSFAFPSCGFSLTPYSTGGATKTLRMSPVDFDHRALQFRMAMLWIRSEILALAAPELSGAEA